MVAEEAYYSNMKASGGRREWGVGEEIFTPKNYHEI